MATTAEPNSSIEDHPDGPAIRRQVEFYFSDENLPTDKHLLTCCNGRENLPVSFSRICGFKKMRKFNKKHVADALRKSAFLVVTENGKQVSRKVPLDCPTILDPDYFIDNEIAYDPRANAPIVYPVPLLAQEKKQYPPGMSKNMMKPTGFENTYVEPPITPDEAKIDEALYDPDKHFVERIEIAIQRFKKKRRMHEKYAQIFNKWMHFGGVECGPRMFSGLSNKDMGGMDAEEIARATASHNVPWDREDTKKWEVDFVGVGEGFLSSYFPLHFSTSTPQIKTACQVLRSFYNYLLYHSVCPEYRPSLLAALSLCDRAEAELPKAAAAALALPGAFNTAASSLCGGSHAGSYTGNQDWAIRSKQEGIDIADTGVMDEQARITFRTGVAVMGSDEQQSLIEAKTIKVVNDASSVGLEVVSITPSDALTREMYAVQNSSTAGRLTLEPLGRLVCRSWHVDDFSEWDLPRDRFPSGRPSEPVEREYVFWVEDEVLEMCYVGMKMEAEVLEVESGVMVLDGVVDVMCSFYRWLPNELLMVYRPRQVNVKERGVDVGTEEDGVGEGEGEGKGEGEGEARFADDESVVGEAGSDDI